MRVKLKDFQAGAVERLLSSMGKMQELYERDGMLSAVSLTAPTGSGKTVTAVKLAKALADKKRNVALLLCDMTAPMLPCICPPSELECERSLGSVLAVPHISDALIKNNCVTHKRLSYLTLLGMKKGENEYTYPPYTEQQATELLDGLREIAPYIIVDCGSYIANDIRREDVIGNIAAGLVLLVMYMTQIEK